MKKIGVLCYSLTPSTVDLIERIKNHLNNASLNVVPLVKTELYSKPDFDYVEPDNETKFFSFGKNKEENQLIKISFFKMYNLARNSDVVLSFGVQSFPCLLLSFFCKIFKTKLIIAHQTMSVIGESNKNKMVYFLKKLAINNASAHIAQTPSSREVLHKIYGVKAIYDAYWDGGLSTLINLEDNESISCNECVSDLKLLFVGSLIPLKNIETIIKAIGVLSDKSHVTLNIIGHDAQYPGWEKYLKEVAITENVSHKVNFLGRKNLTEIIDYYKNSDVVLLPSIKEAWAKVMVEGAYYENALITSSVNGQSGYLVQDNVTGFVLEDSRDYVTLAERIETLDLNRGTLAEFKKEAKKYVINFSSELDEVEGYKLAIESV
ncbi:glycosyltransferase [Vibrio parahaemolyticus]